MKKIVYIVVYSLLLLALSSTRNYAQVSSRPLAMPEIGMPWKNAELLEPAGLANAIKADNAKGIILNIGVVENIPGAIHIGPVTDPQNMEQLQKALAAVPKNKAVVIYCGCCPFAKCPNIRPAYQELKKLGFTQIKVLDLPTNLKTNWIDKGYPLAKD